MAFFPKQLLTTQMYFCLAVFLSVSYSLLNLEISQRQRASRPNSFQVLWASSCLSSCLLQTFRDPRLMGDLQEQWLTWNLVWGCTCVSWWVYFSSWRQLEHRAAPARLFPVLLVGAMKVREVGPQQTRHRRRSAGDSANAAAWRWWCSVGPDLRDWRNPLRGYKREQNSICSTVFSASIWKNIWSIFFAIKWRLGDFYSQRSTVR